MRFFAFAAGLAALAFAAPASAAEYMFSLSWEPTFCATHQGATECQAMTPDSYYASHVVLHGLWPQPQTNQYCGVPQAIIDQDNRHQWSSMPAVTVSDATRQRMNSDFPGVASYLDRHEWYKHGTCTGLSPDAYFSLAMTLVDQANALKFGQFITANVGNTIKTDDLCGALTNDFGAGFLQATTALKGNSDLSEIRIALRDTDAPLALDTAHLLSGSQRMKCTGTLKIKAAGKPQS
jgi:ribonuclease T2